jgi:hypothetical protein
MLSVAAAAAASSAISLGTMPLLQAGMEASFAPLALAQGSMGKGSFSKVTRRMLTVALSL